MSVNTWLWYWVSGEWCWPWWAKEHETRGKGHIHSALSPVTTTKLSEGTPPTNKSTCHLFAPYDMQVISLQLPYKGLWVYAFQLLTCYRDSLSRLPIWTLLESDHFLTRLSAEPKLSVWAGCKLSSFVPLKRWGVRQVFDRWWLPTGGNSCHAGLPHCPCPSSTVTWHGF